MRILIVDDHAVVRTGLRTLLESRAGMEVVGEAGSAAEAVERARATRPDLVLMDVRLPDESGVEACRRIRAAIPQTKVLMLTSYSDDEAVFSSVMAGASGYLLKQIDVDKLYQAISRVEKGESLLDSEMTRTVMERVKAVCEGAPGREIDALTSREKEILSLIAEGMTNREIAERVYLSEKTVRNYVSSILQKLGVAHRTQAAIYYLSRKKDGADEPR